MSAYFMKIKVKITKTHIFVVIGILIIISGLFLINAYNSNWASSPEDPQVAGHTPDEIYVYWNKLLGMPSGFADGVDNEGVVNCGSGKVRVGSDCYALPACSSTKALRWTGSSFVCVSV